MGLSSGIGSGSKLGIGSGSNSGGVLLWLEESSPSNWSQPVENKKSIRLIEGKFVYIRPRRLTSRRLTSRRLKGLETFFAIGSSFARVGIHYYYRNFEGFSLVHICFILRYVTL